MSKLYYYCPECGSFYPFYRVKRRIKYGNDRFQRLIKYHPVPKECFNCNNCFLEVLSYDEIKQFKLKGAKFTHVLSSTEVNKLE